MQSSSTPRAVLTSGSTTGTPRTKTSPREGFLSDASSYNGISSDAGTPQTPKTPAGEEDYDFGALLRCRSAPAKPKVGNPVRAAAASAQKLSFKDVDLPKGGVAKSPRTLSKEKEIRLSKAELKRGTE